jgi:hypothetical protein
MLRACVLKDSKNWDKCLLYAEFSYNNSYQKILKMSPFEDMDASVELHCFGMNLEKIKSLDLKYFEKKKGKFKLIERTYN